MPDEIFKVENSNVGGYYTARQLSHFVGFPSQMVYFGKFFKKTFRSLAN